MTTSKPPSTTCPDGPDDAPCTLHEGHEGGHENFYAQTSWCVPAGMNRAERRAHKNRGHLWKTGSEPSQGRFCAVCGKHEKETA